MSTTKFATEVAIYFRDFLETNFHKRRAPKRSINSRNDKNLLVGINLATFDALRTQIFKSVSSSLKQGISIEKGRYTHGLSDSTWQIISRYCDAVREADLKEACELLQKFAAEVVKVKDADLDSCKEVIKEKIKDVVSDAFFKPLVGLISTTLKTSHAFDEDMTGSILNELREILDQRAASLASDYAIAALVEKKNGSLNVSELISLHSLRGDIKTYFDALKVEDLFFKFSELVSNSEIVDKQQVYLYLLDIKFGGSSYPLFYVPVEATRSKDTIRLEFDSTIYINKKAIDFIVENINKASDKKGSIKSASERIIHLADEKVALAEIMENVANDLLNYFELEGLFDIKTSRIQKFKSHQVSISNSCHFALFDKSDEALVNDYEELIALLNAGGVLSEEFCSLLEGFLTKEPASVVSEVEREWQETEVQDKLVNVSPIPLNEEQNQIVSALKKRNCKYVVVQGPPGTGKSHTITALVFSAILDHKSVLVLSDKKEALDVVEDKIVDTLNNVRHSDDFQNPILRLGKAGNTYSKILSNESLSNIKNHFKAISNNKDGLSRDIAAVTESLKTKISKEINEYSGIDVKEICRLEQLEAWLSGRTILVDVEEFLKSGLDSIEDIESLRQIATEFCEAFDGGDSPWISTFKEMYQRELSRENVQQLLQCVELAIAIETSGIEASLYSRVQGLTLDNLSQLKSIVLRASALGRGLFGYWFKGAKLAELLSEFKVTFVCSEILSLKDQRHILERVVAAFELLESELRKRGALSKSGLKFENLVPQLLSLNLESLRSDSREVLEDLDEVAGFVKRYQRTARAYGLDAPSKIISSVLASSDAEEFEVICEYLRLRVKLETSFKGIPTYDFVQSKTAIERLYTAQMTQILDQRVIEFSEQQSARSKTLKKIISAKKRFPKEEFEYLKEAFPCIISGIRDYAEFIPLDAGLFDLVIIDEASQVSIAQALPAILRAKKVVVFGDKRQFSNIKSAQAKSEVNQQYVQNVRTCFLENHTPSASELERLTKFNIKTSVLDFFEYISNFNSMLRKHFRGYRELISYSSKHFYSDHLQAIKIRGKPIDETIQFIVLEHDGRLDKIENTNSLEIERVVALLEEQHRNGSLETVAVITPHTQQQKMIFERLMKHELWEDFQKKFKLKVMTFDTCQGEERDVIIYSMVASPVSDKLGYIFIKDLKDIDFDEENKIKAQRLNVGFSRAKERMIFVLSKPVSEFAGSIGEALRHFEKTLVQARSLPTADDMDQKSPMEKKVLEWIQETAFFKEHKASIEIKAQFPIGDYLKQLNPTYRHPKYVCDFMLTYLDGAKKVHRIIVEYDGFKEHFTNLDQVNEFNYSSYYSDDDVFREKVLEGYGYRFLRINRFNMGKDPISMLDSRLRGLIKTSLGETNPSFVKEVQNIISNLEDGNLKECSKCGKLRALSEFKDHTLSTGSGRHCRSCKSQPVARRRERYSREQDDHAPRPSSAQKNVLCPKCGSVMRQRNGPRGPFYGCSRFPSCRGSRNIA